MQAVSQSYSSQAYASIQNGLPFSGDRTSSTQKSPTENLNSTTSSDENVTLSADGKQFSRNNETQAISEEKESIQSNNNKSSQQQELTQEELKIITELQKRDKEVRTHEQAHLAAAGQYAAGGASFSYSTGPDGKRYANGGSVPIDLGKEKTPEATIQKMRTVRRAALAPANPSGADRNIAAQASSKEAQAMKEIQTEAQVAPPEASMGEDRNNDTAANRSTETSKTEQTIKETKPPQVSDFSRKSMTSAYQYIAALAT